MAKTGMICPFSGRLCEDCASYRGRHYFLCFCEAYRGYMKTADKKRKAKPNGKFEMPVIKISRDIFDAALKDIK